MFGFVRKVFIASLANEVSASSHIKGVSLSNQKCESHPTIMNLRPMNTLKYCVTILFLLIQTDVSEAVILLMTCLTKFVFQTKQKT